MESNFLKIAAEIIRAWWGEFSWGGYQWDINLVIGVKKKAAPWGAAFVY